MKTSNMNLTLLTTVVMGVTLGHFSKPEKNLEFFRLKNAPVMTPLVFARYIFEEK